MWVANLKKSSLLKCLFGEQLKNDVSCDEHIQPYLHDGNLLNGKNQVADDAGILKKIGSRILNFRIIIVERLALLSSAISNRLGVTL